jgi:tetratricopeptide (TPR) repeat protein
MMHRHSDLDHAQAGPSTGSLSRRVCASALVVSVGLVVMGTAGFGAVAAAQARRAQPPLQPATRAVLEGRYDEVDQLTAALDQRDPNVVALKARAAIARGRYADAEAALRPVAMRAPASAAALELGLLAKMLGRNDATAILRAVAANASDLIVAARALHALGAFDDANDVFRNAVARAPKDPEANTAWGELYLDAHQKADALELFSAALEGDQKWTPAILGAAQALVDDDPPQAVAAAKKALEINPSYVDAHVFLASQSMDQDQKEEARESLQKALTINPSSLEAHAGLAAIAYVEDKTAEFDAEVAKVLAISPAFGEVYRVAGELTAHNYRFDEAVTLLRRGLALEPQNPEMLSELGMHLLRTGDEPGARAALDASFKLFPRDKPTLNMLTMLDNLDKFVTVRDGDLIFKFDPAEVAVLQEYAIPLAHKALKEYAERYEFTPKGPILIEVFPKQDDFAVRNVGLPGMLGALGACFGRVVTMVSPKARQGQTTFQWEATLWHELGHVVTIQVSNQRVPRWLTEGISEFEQKRARPEWARQMDMEFASLMNDGKVIKLRDLNPAFRDPRKIGIAYFQGSVVVDYLMETYGQAGVNKLLRAYGQGLDTNGALKSALNTDFDQMQTGFDAMLERRFGPIRKPLAGPGPEELSKKSVEELLTLASAQPGSYWVEMALGRALRKAGDADPGAATRAFEAAAKLVPISPAPRNELAQIALEKKDRPRAITELEALVATDFDNVEAARGLASQMRQANITDVAKVRAVNERIVAIDPFDGEAHSILGRLAMDRKDFEAASRDFKAVLALNPIDRAAAHTDLAASYLKLGKAADAKKQTLAALEIAPSYTRAQELLLELVEAKK